MNARKSSDAGVAKDENGKAAPMQDRFGDASQGEFL